MTPSTQEFITTTKGGIDLASFEQVDLYKKVAKPTPVTSIQDALTRLGNDQPKLLLVLTEGLQAEAVRHARESEDGWLTYKEDGTEGGEAFTGALADGKDVNPLILQFAKLMFGFDDAAAIADTEKKREAKRSAKEQAMEYIKTQPRIIEAFKSRMVKTANA